MKIFWILRGVINCFLTNNIFLSFFPLQSRRHTHGFYNICIQGPGSQQSENPYEADANFGKVVEGMDDVVPRIHSVKQMGWLSEANQIKIIKKTILVPDSRGTGFVEWKDPLKDDAATR